MSGQCIRTNHIHRYWCYHVKDGSVLAAHPDLSPHTRKKLSLTALRNIEQIDTVMLEPISSNILSICKEYVLQDTFTKIIFTETYIFLQYAYIL